MRRNLWRVLFAVALLSTCYACLTPLPKSFQPPVASDKLVHFAMFAVDAALAIPAFAGPSRGYVLLAVTALGVVLELLQSLVPNRSTSAADALANALGVGAVWLCLLLWRAFRQKSV